MDSRRFARFAVLTVFCLSVCAAQTQGQIDLRDQVPKIAFETWRSVEETDRLTEYLTQFPSPLETEWPENNSVPVRVFVPKGLERPAPVVLILHYWGARDIRVERSMAGQLADRGIASMIVTLPYHLTRAPKGTRSGELAIQPNPAKLRATMMQAVLDVKRSIDFLESRGDFDLTRLGILGTSLGALVSALAYGVEPRFTHAAFVLGGVDLAEIMWSSSLVVEARDALRRQGYTFERLRAELTSVEPLTYLGSRRSSSAFVIGGKFDTIVPAQSTRSLIDAFESAKTIWLDTGHYGGIFVQSRVLKEVANYFQTEFEGKTYQPPRRIFAPTLRIGAMASTPRGFDIGIGVDLWKSNQRGDLIAIGLLTPRGPQIFLGGRISSGLSIGAVGGTNRVGIGLLWSRPL